MQNEVKHLTRSLLHADFMYSKAYVEEYMSEKYMIFEF
jgi:hypothetical protein